MKRASEFSAFTPLNNTGSDVMQGMIGGGGVQRNGTSGSAFKRSSESSNSEKNKS